VDDFLGDAKYYKIIDIKLSILLKYL
jgi:hypothetical protein